MNRKVPYLIFILVWVFSIAQPRPVQAHPADVYTHSIHVTLAQNGLSIKWEIKPGPLLISYIWFDADTDQDDSVSPEEAGQWAGARASLFTAMLDSARLPLQFDGVQFPSDLDKFQAGQEFITFNLSAVWTETSADSFQLTFHNGVEQQKSLNWYFIESRDSMQFQTPQQKNSNITLDVLRPSAQNSTQTQLLSVWDSSVPSLILGPGGAAPSTPEPAAPSIQQNARQEMLLNLVRNEPNSIPFFAFALAVSLALGALHAMTPGHGKTVVAAYLVGSRGTTRHAIGLGMIVTLTHTGSVFLLGLITLIASRYILPTSIIPALEIFSGLLIIGFGSYLLRQRFQVWRSQPANPGPARSFSVVKTRAPLMTSKQALGDHDHEHGHSHEVPETLTWRSLIALGVSGGLVPCPDAIAILLVAVALNRILLGLALIVSFSLGLAVVLIVIGLLMVNSRRLFDRTTRFNRFMPALPMLSALIVVALGVGLTYGAYVRAKDGSGAIGSGGKSVNAARIIYLVEGSDRLKQLFIANVSQNNPSALTEGPNSVVEYALAPNGSQVAYIVQTDNLGNEIWLVDLSKHESKKLSDCANAVCSGPIWSPDGGRLVYEYMSLSGDNATGLSTLWWLDLISGETRPVFAESQLPGGNARWSPDGKWLSYATAEGVRLSGLESGENHMIKSLLGAAANWSPDGKKILYRDVIIQDNQFVTQLFIYELASQTARNVDPDLAYENILAAWSPDGALIAVVRRDLSVQRGDQIWLISADGSKAHALTNAPSVLHGSLEWSPDGKYLLYDLYELDSIPLESSLQMVEVGSGKITDLGIKGYNPKWLLLK